MNITFSNDNSPVNRRLVSGEVVTGRLNSGGPRRVMFENRDSIYILTGPQNSTEYVGRASETIVVDVKPIKNLIVEV